jgi:hypothetical protein
MIDSESLAGDILPPSNEAETTDAWGNFQSSQSTQLMCPFHREIFLNYYPLDCGKKEIPKLLTKGTLFGPPLYLKWPPNASRPVRNDDGNQVEHEKAPAIAPEPMTPVPNYRRDSAATMSASSLSQQESSPYDQMIEWMDSLQEAQRVVTELMLETNDVCRTDFLISQITNYPSVLHTDWKRRERPLPSCRTSIMKNLCGRWIDCFRRIRHEWPFTASRCDCYAAATRRPVHETCLAATRGRVMWIDWSPRGRSRGSGGLSYLFFLSAAFAIDRDSLFWFSLSRFVYYYYSSFPNQLPSYYPLDPIPRLSRVCPAMSVSQPLHARMTAKTEAKRRSSSSTTPMWEIPAISKTRAVSPIATSHSHFQDLPRPHSSRLQPAYPAQPPPA